MNSFVINSSQLEWSWDTKSSNYSKLKKDAFDESKGKSCQAQKTTGTPPACPSFPGCGDPGSSPGGGGNASAGGWDDRHNTGSSPGSSSACAMTQGPGAPAMLSVLALTAALAFSRRCRRA